MKKSILTLSLVLVSTLFLYGCTQSNNNTDTSTLGGTREEATGGTLIPTETQETAQENTQLAVFNVSDVDMHKDITSCRSIISGNVYDLTTWIPKHPGGEDAILQLCGKDGTKSFEAMHGGKELQAKTLAGFKIGTLSE